MDGRSDKVKKNETDTSATDKKMRIKLESSTMITTIKK